MNRPIRAVAIFSFILVVALIANLTYIQGFQQKSLAEHPLNSRQFLEAKSRERGSIIAGDQVLARSVKDSEDFYDRQYPYMSAKYGSVVGYLSDQFGAAGIESSQNSILTGEDDSLFATRTWDMLTGKETGGANVELTLNPRVQEVAYDELANKGYSGSVVALRPSTGEVLAMASTPSADPSQIVGPSSEQAQQNFQNYANNENSPLLSRSTQQIQPPGSTFKVITTAAALEEGDTPDTSVTAAPQITLPDSTTTLENYGGTACGGGGSTTLREAFKRSCNTAFVDISTRHGVDKFKDIARGFGVGEEDDYLGLPVVPSRVGDVPDDSALAQSSIGQRDVALTPLQNASIAATIANGGVRMKPYMVSKITGRDLSTLRTTKPQEAGRAIPEETSETLKELMVGAEQWAGGDGSIASKTGTAEHGEDSRNSNPHAWYIAFSTTSDVAVAVLVENGGDRGQAATGGSVAGPIGRAVIHAAEKEQQ